MLYLLSTDSYSLMNISYCNLRYASQQISKMVKIFIACTHTYTYTSQVMTLHHYTCRMVTEHHMVNK